MDRKNFLKSLMAMGIGSTLPEKIGTDKAERVKILTTRMMDVRGSDYQRNWRILKDGLTMEIKLYDNLLQQHIGGVGFFYEGKRVGGLGFYYNDILSPMISSGHFKFEAVIEKITAGTNSRYIADVTLYCYR